MILSFAQMEETPMPQFKGGEKTTFARMYTDAHNRIMRSRLEPGASCTDRAAWPAEGEEAPAWRYTAYRVAAGVLHWMDGDWLRPGEDGYAAQQELITDAYENGALVLAPGDWENGMAGEMALVLPDAMGNVSALETYLTAGLLVEESGGEARMGAEARP